MLGEGEDDKAVSWARTSATGWQRGESAGWRTAEEAHARADFGSY